MAKDKNRSPPLPVAANDDDQTPFDQARFDDAVIAVARLIGRPMARDTIRGQAAANDNDAACSGERQGTGYCATSTRAGLV
jgi:hypothetical protein